MQVPEGDRLQRSNQSGGREGNNNDKADTPPRPRLAFLPAPGCSAADCDITVGVVMELTGPAGEYGQAGAKSVEMAFRDINDAGGVRWLRAH